MSKVCQFSLFDRCKQTSCHPSCLKYHSLVPLAVHDTLKICRKHFISKASILRSSSFFKVHLSQPYTTTGHISAFMSRIFVEICIPWFCQIFLSFAPIPRPFTNLPRMSSVHSVLSVMSEKRYGKEVTLSEKLLLITMLQNVPFVVSLCLFGINQKSVQTFPNHQFSTFCNAFHISVTGEVRHFKFDGSVCHSMS